MVISNDLGFTKQWFELGMISDHSLAEMEREWESGEDPYSEHYRYRAFSSFMESRPVLPSETLIAIYKLGSEDPDPAMGGSMMKEVLQRKDCPDSLLREALDSQEEFLRKVAARQLGL